MKPFLKWPGNKYSIRQHIIATLPAGKRLIEPFAGSGAIFLNTDYPKYILAEQNLDLVNLYQLLQREGHSFIKYCGNYFTAKYNHADSYYQLRTEFNQTSDIRRRCALFVYLNKHGYNGLCRYNSKGGYNVPFGSYTKPYFPAAEMSHFHVKSQNAQFIHSDFQHTMASAKVGDVVYCDPPYVPLSVTANFSSYTKSKFGKPEQIILANLAQNLAQRGISVVISNHDTPFTRQYYHNAEIHGFYVQRNISCNGNLRVKVAELVAVFCAH